MNRSIDHYCETCGTSIGREGYCPTHPNAMVVSTFDTDWVPLAKRHFEALGDLLRRNGHPVTSPAYLALKASECALGFVPRQGLPGYFLGALTDAIKGLDERQKAMEVDHG